MRRRASAGGGEDRDRGERDGDPRRLGEEQDAGRADRRERREQQGVRGVAGEVLAQRRLEPAERGERHAADEQRAAEVVVAPDHAPDEHHEPGEDAQLDERERVPRRARALVAPRCGTARRGGRCGRRQRRPAALAAALAHQAKGQPEETFTRHQPISRPSRPSRGRTCQARQPGRPSSALVTLTQRWRLRGRVHRREQLGAAVGAQVRDAVGELVADALELAEGEQARAGLRRGGAAGARGLAPREDGGERAGELALQPADLVAQVAARGALAGRAGRERDSRGDDGHRRPPSWRQCTTGPAGRSGAGGPAWTAARRRHTVRVPRNDPTDTGGLFIGRRPGTAPVRYRKPPERAGGRRRLADATLAAAVLLLEALVVLSLWGPQPVAWMWVGSQVDYHSGSVFLGITAAFLGLIGSLILTLMVATRLDHLWRLLRRAAGHDQRDGVLGRLFVVTAIVAAAAFTAWFLLIEGPGSSIAPR